MSGHIHLSLNIGGAVFLCCLNNDQDGLPYLVSIPENNQATRMIKDRVDAVVQGALTAGPAAPVIKPWQPQVLREPNKQTQPENRPEALIAEAEHVIKLLNSGLQPGPESIGMLTSILKMLGDTALSHEQALRVSAIRIRAQRYGVPVDV